MSKLGAQRYVESIVAGKTGSEFGVKEQHFSKKNKKDLKAAGIEPATLRTIVVSFPGCAMRALFIASLSYTA